MDEPTVLDYVKSRLFPWKYGPLHIPAEPPDVLPDVSPDAPSAFPAQPGVAVEAPDRAAVQAADWPWRGLLALVLAMVAQFALEPQPNRDWKLSALLYAFSAAAIIWSYGSGEWRLPVLPVREAQEDATERLLQRPFSLTLSIPLALAAFLVFGDNQFTLFNVLLWVVALGLFAAAFWEGNPFANLSYARVVEFVRRPAWGITITPWTLALVAAAGLVLFFRLSQLEQVPPQMNSDHAEKLLDVLDVLNGDTRIFFLRNTGREFVQFYLTAAVIKWFGTGLTFLSLKIGTAIAGLVTLVYIYFLGKEIGNRQTGLWAAVFAGIAYWPNVITRIALRFSLYPLFVAPTLYYLIRGLRRSNRNDFILAGISLGLGLHGYSSFRIVPFVVVIMIGLYLLHRQSQGERMQTLSRLGLLALVSFIVFLPLLRFALGNPEIFAYRAFTRLSDWERPLPGPAWLIFLVNLWRAETMFFWDNGEIWLHSIPHRPALSAVAAALYFLGSALVLARYLRNRHWLDLFLLLSVPLLMLPSILSLAFPGENPSLNRTAGAIVPVFIILGIGVESLVRSLAGRLGSPRGTRFGWTLALILLGLSALQDYHLVFERYARQYSLSSWNSSEMGQVVRDFAETFREPDNVWVMSFPHWVDTRLVAFNAGFPGRDYEMFVERLELTQAQPGPKLFILNPQDEKGQFNLHLMYPEGWMSEYPSAVETKNFLIYFVPPGD